MAEKSSSGIASVRLIESVWLGGTETVTVVTRTGAAGGGVVAAVTPARLETDGSAVAIETKQRADGLLLVATLRDRGNGSEVRERVFVPWSNVRQVRYE
jgi:hypothetical protein